MHEIICPHCKKAFKIDEAGYADIQKQVRDSEFDKQREELGKVCTTPAPVARCETVKA
jgi:hypothetical protein